MRYRAIHEYDRRYPIRLMCRALAVSPARYYAWRVRPESRRSAANRVLLTDIRMIHQESRQTYGSPSIWHVPVCACQVYERIQASWLPELTHRFSGDRVARNSAVSWYIIVAAR